MIDDVVNRVNDFSHIVVGIFHFKRHSAGSVSIIQIVGDFTDPDALLDCSFVMKDGVVYPTESSLEE